MMNETTTGCLDPSMIQSQLSSCCQLEDQDNNEQYMYSHGIVIPSNLDSRCIPSVILFNLALSHHLAAAARPSHQKRFLLEKAVRLYVLAYTFQSKLGCSNVLFTLATSNNLGLIHTELEHSDMSKQCFDHLLSVLMLVVDSQNGNRVGHLDGFVQNVVSLSSKDCPAAAVL